MQRFGVTRRVRMGIVIALCVVVSAYPVYAATATAAVFTESVTPDVIITEFQTNGGSASQEFVELYNTTDKDIDFGSSWRLQFFNSTAVKSGTPAWDTSPTASNSITLSGLIPAHDYFLIGSTDYKPGSVDPDQTYSPASSHLMTDTGGGLQLLSTGASSTEYTVYDRAMWLDAKTNPVLPAEVLPRPASGKSQQRIPDENDEYLTADKAVLPFVIEADITPLAPYREPEPEPVVPVGTGIEIPEAGMSEQSPVVTTPGNSAESIPPYLTEIMPNPGSPLTDAKDEFIELYNPNSAAINLSGYELEVGTTTLHDYTIPADTIVAPYGYITFYASQTNLPLANNTGQVRLKDAEGKTISESAVYTDAGDNRSWIYDNGTWEWSASVTPGAANILTVPAAAAAASTASTPKSSSKTTSKTTAKAATTKKAAPKKTTTKTAKKAKASTAKKAKKAKKAKTVKKSKKSQSAATTAADTKPKPPIHIGILVGVGVIALLYGLYEYRHDIANKYRQLKENRGARRVGGVQAAWRRGYSTN